MPNTAPIPIAIVGMSCRFPGGANNPDQLWDMLAEGRSGWTDVPADRFNWKSFHHPSPEARGAQNSRGGHFIDQDISEFDNLFFGITPEEASSLDPQQRLQLMTAYEAIENAGIPIESVRGSNTSVHIAVVSRDYDRMMYKDPSDIPKYHLTGCGDATVCGRISYTFDFRGPSVTLDTGCSGSMVGLHQACQGLRLGESSMALVGGTNLLLGPDMTIAMSMLHMLNDDGRCYSFDSRGSGYGRAEGVATIVLKRLDDAILAGDPIRAIIRNTGVNQDGKTNGILLPSSESQQALARSMYEAIELDPCTVGYVEAHGTGTAAGDAAELNSISNVFCADGRREAPLYVGSVKANIGHLESASGLAGIIKTVLAMEKRLIPPVPNILVLKENLDLEKHNIKIPQELQQWPNDGVLHASINSFGFGGTNSHVILESAPRQNLKQESSQPNGINGTSKVNGVNGTAQVNGNHKPMNQYSSTIDEEPHLFVISAKSKQSLNETASHLKSWLSSGNVKKSLLPDLAHTLSTRRSKMAWRSSFIASSAGELIQSLSSPRPTRISLTSRVAFLFTGQGAQWFGMGRELIRTNSIFGKSLSRSEQILVSFGASWSLLEELHKDEKSSRVNESQISQPATIAIQIGLVDLMNSLSIQPHSVLGHSSGEVAAAYACGILSQESALKVAFHRGFASSWYQQTSNVKGAMIAVGLGEKDVKPYISHIKSGICSVACQNSPVSTTVSGDEEAIDELKSLLDNDSVFNRKLKIDTAYHSHHMKVIANQYLDSLEDLKYSDPLPSTKFFSSVTGKEKASDFGASYWVENLTSTVRFSDALQALILSNTQTSHLILELGPHSALQGPVRQSITYLNQESFKYLYFSALLRGQDGRRSILDVVGKLFEQGCPVNFEIASLISSGNSSQEGKVLNDLPPYSWDLTKHWHESRLSRDYRFRSYPYHDLLGLRVIGSTPLEPSWRNILSVDGLPWLHEHIIDKFALFPGSGFLCMAIEGMVQLTQDRATTVPRTISKFILKDISFSKALIIPDSPEKIEVILSVRSSNSAEKSPLSWELFCITSLGPDGIWNEHCRGSIALEFASPDGAETEKRLEDELSAKEAVENLQNMKESCTEAMDTMSFYDELRGNGIDYGTTFSTIQKLNVGPCQAVAVVKIPDVSACMPSGHLEPHVIHPATFDALMHIALPLYSRHCSEGPAMLISIDEVTVSADIISAAGNELIVACDLSPTGPLSGSVDVSVFQADIHSAHQQVLTLSGQTFRGIGEGQTSNSKIAFAQDKSFQVDLRDLEEETAEEITHLVSIIYEHDATTQETLASGLLAALLSKGVEASISKGLPDQLDENTIYLILGNTKTAFLSETFLNTAKSVMIVRSIPKPGSYLDSKQPPTDEFTAPQRLNKSQRFVCFNMQGTVDGDLHATKYILKALVRSFSDPENGKGFERDYFYTANELKVPRLTEATGFGEWVARKDGKETVGVGLFQQENRPLRLDVPTPGLLDSLVFVDDESAQKILGSDELEIDVHTHAVNQKDVVIAMGRLSSRTPMIGEFAGIVTAVGSNAQAKFTVGDRVCGWGGLPYRSKSRINWQLAHRLPDSFSFTKGASIPYAFQTAYHALVDIGNLQRGGAILIHSALSGVGIAAVIIAQYIGADIFATVANESASKRDMLLTQFNIPATHIFSNSSNIFRKGIRRTTSGRGVDVVLNLLPGMLSDTVTCVAEFGTIIDLSKSKEQLPLYASDKNITFASIDMASLAKNRPERIQNLFGRVMSLFSNGSFKPTHPLTEMSMSNIVDAFRLVQIHKHTGKVVLTVDKDTQVRQRTIKPQELHLSGNGAYIIAGGDDEIVKSTYTFMTKHGAKQIILLKNQTSGAQDQVLDEALTERLDMEVHACDINSPDQVASFASKLENRGTIVYGIVQFSSPQRTLKAFQSESLGFLINILPLSSISLSSRIFSSDNESDSNAISVSLGSITPEELSLTLEYIMGPQAKLDKCRHLIVGTDRKSIDAENSGSEDPFFSQLEIRTDTPGGSDGDNKGNRGIGDAKTLHEAEGTTTQLVATKLAALVAIDEDDIDLDLPFSELGLDSLVAIDFKNWIGRAFAAPMQTSEILDASSIRNLAVLIVKRSALVTSETRAKWTGTEDSVIDTIPQFNGAVPVSKPNGSQSLTTSKPKIPALPLPDLEASLQMYLNTVRPFCSDKEFARTYDAVNEFQKPGGLGRKLHARLAKLANDPSVDCWLEDIYNNSSFLNRRVQMVPYVNFFFTHKLSPFPHSQSERAAIIAESAFKYQQLLEGDQLPVQYLNEQPVCTSLYKWLFNAARRPALRTDTMHKFLGNNYLVALSRGRVFKIPLMEGSKNASYKKLKVTFEVILSMSRDDTPVLWTGILTADERNSWAKIRKQLQEISTSNALCLDVIEAASFLICLDEASPSNSSERAQHYHFGDGSNRWNDKSLQFPVCSNGISGIIGDHSMMDAGTVFGLNAFVTQAILDHKREDENVVTNGTSSISLEEYFLTTDESLELQIQRVQQDFIKSTSGAEHAFFTIHGFGASALRSIKCPPKSAFQVISMLASFEHFGGLEPCWESVSLSNFYKGRVENTQGLLPPVAEFLTSVNDETIPIETRRKLFLEAAKAHASSISRAVRGRGFDRYFTSLREVIQKGEGPVAMFEDPIFARTRPRKFMSHTHETGMMEQGYLLRDPDSIWQHYVVEDDCVKLSMAGPIGRTKDFRALLEKSTKTVKALLGI